jgi:uncharacterized protein (DUF1330 family)
VIVFGPWESLFGERAYDNGMIVRFPDKDTALAWYNSPAYQALWIFAPRPSTAASASSASKAMSC